MECELFDLGLIEYGRASCFQRLLLHQVFSASIKGALVVCRHQPVITLGRQAQATNILASEDELTRRGIAVYPAERGGDVTYHGPGQITLYPIINLGNTRKDIRWYLRTLEEVIIATLAAFGVRSKRRLRMTGVWVEGEKICSIGVAIRRWVAWHGLSVNILRDDLGNFKLIRPCGMDIRMTCLESVLSQRVDIECVKQRLVDIFCDIFSFNPPQKSPVLPAEQARPRGSIISAAAVPAA